jgi:hypothetical protein
MKSKFCPRICDSALRCIFPSVRAFTRSATIGVFFGLALCAVPSFAAEDGMPPVQAACGFTDDAFDTATDIHALDEYQDAIALLLQRKKFAELDCIADEIRATKARFSGGAWKLHFLYLGLQEPRPGHPTQEDWHQHMALVEQWTQLKPRSITARIALAESYNSDAWDARGDGYADSVSNSGWKLFGQRLEKSRQILETAAALKAKCPEWYVAMEVVAQGEEWDLSKVTELFLKADAFDPTYQYYYRSYAYLLLPKWIGEEGDAARFAEKAADQIGGDDGDILYFMIASKVVCACQETEYAHFSWPRLQKGFAAIEKKYGPDLVNTNNLAMMAVKSNDWEVAGPAFERIGHEWDKDVWITEEWFNSNQAIARSNKAAIGTTRIMQQEAEANEKTPEGMAYRKDFDYRFAKVEQSCAGKAKENLTEFDFYVHVVKDGSVDNAWGTHPTPMMQCLMQTLYDGHVRNEKPFPAPPAASYWVSIHIDPSKADTAMK